MKRILFFTAFLLCTFLVSGKSKFYDGTYTIEIKDRDYLKAKQTLTVTIANGNVSSINFQHNTQLSLSQIQSVSPQLHSEFNNQTQNIQYLINTYHSTGNINKCFSFDFIYTSKKFQHLLGYALTLAKRGVKNFAAVRYYDLFYSVSALQNEQGYYSALILYGYGLNSGEYEYNEFNSAGVSRKTITASDRSVLNMSWLQDTQNRIQDLNTNGFSPPDETRGPVTDPLTNLGMDIEDIKTKGY